MLSEALIGVVVGTFLGFILQYLYELIKGAKLKLKKLCFEPFERSARATAIVIHEGGSLPATSAMGFLTLETKTKQLSEIAVKEVDGRCELESLCNLCGGKAYLASPKVEIRSEALPWSLPIEAGTGLEGLKYAHLTHIPVRGLARLRLFDVYRVRVYDYAGGLKDEFWLIKVHSEYGVTHIPGYA
jgi:hypothetical protein